MENKPVIFLILVLAIMISTYAIIKIFSPARQRGQSSTKTMTIKEIEDSKGEKKVTAAPGRSYGNYPAPRMATMADRERFISEYMSERQEQNEILSNSDKARDKFLNAMNGRAGKLFKDALDFAAKQDYDKSIEAFLQALKEEPNNITVRLLAFKKLAALYKQKNDEKKYLVATFKYLEVLEKVEKNPNEVDEILKLKNEIKGKLSNQ
ncbi:MAG: hypothetical protein QMC67_08630 [Candidatus Wallbacteria bacterium]